MYFRGEWNQYFLGDIKLGTECVEEVSVSLKRFLEGGTRHDAAANRVFYDLKDRTFRREVFYLSSPHAMIYAVYKPNGEMELFLDKASYPDDIRKVLCPITDKYFRKWAENIGCDYVKLMPNEENIINEEEF